jgi:ABC-type transport system substrate-binding protein
MDPANRKSISMQLQRKMYEMQPYIFLWANTHCIVVQKTLQKTPIYNYRPGFWIGEWE